jgi:hypothetical protein
MKENGECVSNMETELKCLLMVMFMLVNISMESHKAMDNILGRMVVLMQESLMMV